MDHIWNCIREEAAASIRAEPLLRRWLTEVILEREALEDSLAFILASRLAQGMLEVGELADVITTALKTASFASEAIRADILAVMERDPACNSHIQPLLYLKGYHALQSYRVAHHLWQEGRKDFACFFQSRISAAFDVDIHPAARVGKGVLIDHATSVVIGETAIVEDNVSLLHEVTLGGTGKEGGDRHPIIRSGVLIGAGAKVLGRVEVGRGAKIGAGSVVLADVAAHTTVAGVPARPVGEALAAEPARVMDQRFPCDGEDSV